MSIHPAELEKQAHESLAKYNYDEAYRSYYRAAYIYSKKANHAQAALCFASAASCWAKKSGENTFYNAAVSYFQAAKEAESARDLEYAALLYKYAAINHERDGEFINFSDCFYRSKECLRKFLLYSIVNPHRIKSISKVVSERVMQGFVKRLCFSILLTFSALLWGHGERPIRTFLTACVVILLAAGSYMLAGVSKGGVFYYPDLLESIYLSVVTFTTLGYGDIVPVGISKVAALIEAFSGVFVMPLFLIGLARKYLRV